jgi:hypothetical protein
MIVSRLRRWRAAWRIMLMATLIVAGAAAPPPPPPMPPLRCGSASSPP